jgi:hypothetical protein
MAAKQTPMLLGRFVEHQEYFNALPTGDAQWAIQNPKDAAELCVTAIKSRTNSVPKAERAYQVLRPVAPKPAANRPFKADDTFFNKKSGVKMVRHGDNFTSWFAGKVEENAPEGTLVPFTLTRNAYDREIIADLGGEERAEVTLAEIWRLMERQANGQEGALLTNGWANIFYVRDREGVLRAVIVRWGDDGWSADAYALVDDRWLVARQVFSRNS